MLDKKRRSELIKKIGRPELIKKLINDYSSRNDWLKFIFPLSAIVLTIIAWSGPRKADKSNIPLNKGLDVMIAWDLSKSMLAEDILPNRLERSRLFIFSLMDALASERIGLVFFAGHAYMQMPLTRDHGVARMYLQQASVDLIPTQGTVIDEALNMCQNAFIREDRKSKSIILISDGEGHDQKTGESIAALKETGVVVHAIGVGTQQGGPIPDKISGTFKKDAKGQEIVTRLNATTLKEVARETKGKYIELENVNDAVTQIKAELDKMEKNASSDPSMANYTEYFQWFIAMALLLAVAGFFWPERKKRALA
jgi:Ca-activated chloride channel family protein